MKAPKTHCGPCGRKLVPKPGYAARVCEGCMRRPVDCRCEPVADQPTLERFP